MRLNSITNNQGKTYNLTNGEENLDFAIFLTQDLIGLINYSFFYSENLRLGEVKSKFDQETRKGYKFFNLYIVSLFIKEILITEDRGFAFNSYLYQDKNSSIAEKSSKVTALYSRISNLIEEINEKVIISDYENLYEKGKHSEIEKSLKDNYEPLIVIAYDHLKETIKLSGFFYRAVVLQIGIALSYLRKKMLTELSGFLNFEVLKEQEKINISLSSRDEILNKLIGVHTNNYKKFLGYEKKLIRENYLNETRDEWLKSAASFIRFYELCQHENIFKHFYLESSKGVILLRELYHFQEGKNLDTPSKRKKQFSSKTKFEFTFLTLI